jgi:hypothetical protein
VLGRLGSVSSTSDDGVTVCVLFEQLFIMFSFAAYCHTVIWFSLLLISFWTGSAIVLLLIFVFANIYGVKFLVLVTVYEPEHGARVFLFMYSKTSFEQEQHLRHIMAEFIEFIENICRQLSTWLSQYNRYLKNRFKGVEQQEFWEIVLISSGDVEQNPGPIFMSGTSIKSTVIML